MTKEIRITQGKKAIVDDDMFEFLTQWKWKYHMGYAARNMKFTNEAGEKKSKVIYMHRLINNTPKGFDTDHIDNDPLNNTRANLRSVTKSQNQMNSKIRSGHSSKFKGVSFIKEAKKYRAYINVKGKFISLGLFIKEKEAALAYNNAALFHYGDFAKLNTLQRG